VVANPAPIVVEVKTLFQPDVLANLVKGFGRETEFVKGETLDNDEDETFMAARYVQVKALAKKIEQVYEGHARGHLDALKKLRDLVNPYKNEVAGLIGAYAGLLGDYAIIKSERAAAALELAKEAAAEREHAVVVSALNLAQANAPQHKAGVSVRVFWRVGEVDLSKLPEEYVQRSPDMTKLSLLAEGTPDTENPPEIPGVTWERDTAQRVRTS
jgi:hypothetical protein